MFLRGFDFFLLSWSPTPFLGCALAVHWPQTRDSSRRGLVRGIQALAFLRSHGILFQPISRYNVELRSTYFSKTPPSSSFSFAPVSPAALLVCGSHHSNTKRFNPCVVLWWRLAWNEWALMGHANALSTIKINTSGIEKAKKIERFFSFFWWINFMFNKLYLPESANSLI